MIRKASRALLVGLCLSAVLVVTASAAGLPAAGSGSISAYVPGGIGLAGVAQPSFQGSVAFKTTGGQTLKNPRVWVSCYQNGALVYGDGGSPDTIFTLGGDWSPWVDLGGGAADCQADLYYILNAKGTGEWNGKGAQGGNVYLGRTAFAAAG